MTEGGAFLPDGEGHFEAELGFEKVEWRYGYVRYLVALKPIHRNRQGLVHGGVIGALVDAAGLFAGTFDEATGRARVAVTVSTSCNYIGAASGEAIAAEGTLLRAGRSMFFASSRVFDPETGDLIASGMGSFRYRN